jgi:hypothetical protein
VTRRINTGCKPTSTVPATVINETGRSPKIQQAYRSWHSPSLHIILGVPPTSDPHNLSPSDRQSHSSHSWQPHVTRESIRLPNGIKSCRSFPGKNELERPNNSTSFLVNYERQLQIYIQLHAYLFILHFMYWTSCERYADQYLPVAPPHKRARRLALRYTLSFTHFLLSLLSPHFASDLPP